MYWFKCGLIILPSCYILSLCSRVTYETKTLDTGLVFLYIASVAIAGKIIYDRYQQINILGSLTTNPQVTSFANKTASFSASSMLVGFLGHLILYAFKVDSYGITAINIFVCAFGTLYMWMQGIVTIYATTLFYDKNLQALRQCLATISSLVLVIMAVLGTIATLLPRGPTAMNVAYVCLYITSMCSYVLAGIFCTFILSFEKDYKYLAEGLPSDLLLDDGCSFNDVSFPETNSLFTAQDLKTSTIIIKGTISSMKVS